MPTLIHQRTDRTKPASRILSVGAKNITSQCGEDGVLINIFNRIGVTASGPWCVEFGAGNGMALSNTLNLIEANHWNAVLIEGDRERFEVLRALHRDNERVHAIHGIVGWEGSEALDEILARTPIPERFDLLSIDIDGNDWFVWEALRNYRPRVVVIEFNPTIPNDVIFIQDRDPEINHGCSLLALIELGRTKGYELIATTTCNGFFIVAEEFAGLGIEDNSIDAIHLPIIDGRIFHGMDGTIFTVGMPRLFWHERMIAPDELQVFSREERCFNDKLAR
ncbi:MAG: FkbM family methyltransferase [Magnetococcales bacterium]|nr:FkbM family methyltransferase [Magnetococcales bacterium]